MKRIVLCSVGPGKKKGSNRVPSTRLCVTSDSAIPPTSNPPAPTRPSILFHSLHSDMCGISRLEVAKRAAVTLDGPFELFALPAELIVLCVSNTEFDDFDALRRTSRCIRRIARGEIEARFRRIARSDPGLVAGILLRLAASEKREGHWTQLLFNHPISLARFLRAICLQKPELSLPAILSPIALSHPDPRGIHSWSASLLLSLSSNDTHAIGGLISVVQSLWRWPVTARTGEPAWDSANLGIFLSRFPGFLACEIVMDLKGRNDFRGFGEREWEVCGRYAGKGFGRVEGSWVRAIGWMDC